MPSICATRRSRPESSAVSHFRSRALDSATKMPRSRRLRHARPRRRRHVALRKPHCVGISRGDVEQHEVHRTFAKPILPRRVLPTRQRQFVASNIAHPRPPDFHLTGMKGDLAPRAPPQIATAPFASRMAGSAGIRCVLVHHLAERRDPHGQAKDRNSRRLLRRPCPQVQGPAPKQPEAKRSQS
jgi:hypothetical protein